MPSRGFSARERDVLRAVCDTLATGASTLGVPEAFEEAVLTHLPPRDRAEMRFLLGMMATRTGMLALAGRPRPFDALGARARERVLLAWGASRVPDKRKAFQAFKRVTLFLEYALRPEGADANPEWARIGYALPDAERVAVARPPPRERFRRADPREPLEADVVVVGSGAGGGVAAARLAQKGLRVLVIEAGEERHEQDFPLAEAEGHRDLYAGGGLFATRDLGVTILAGATAGGGTTVNWTTSLDPPPALLAQWELLGVEGVAGPGFAATLRAVRERVHVTLDESQRNGPNGVLEDGARALGYKEGVDYRILPRNVDGCEGRCVTCVFGCPFGAKRGTLVTYLRDAHDAGARFLFGARVTRVLAEGGRVVGVDAMVADGDATRDVRVKARAVVVAAGAIQSAALLLRSGVRARGLGRLFLHPTTSVPAEFGREIRMWAGPMQTVVVHRFADLDGAGHGVILENAPAHPGLAASALPWRGAHAHAEDMRAIARTAALIVIARDETPGRVTVDKRGAPIVEYRLRRADAERVLTGVRELARLERAAGATRIMTLHQAGVRVDADPRTGRIADADFDAFLAEATRRGARANELGLFSAHQMGTAPMGREGDAVTDPWGRVRDVEGLYVADSSTFPTASGVNPQITIMALAHRVADRVAADVRGT